MIRDLLLIALRSLTKRKVRTFLTLLGIVIGISAVVALIAVGQGLQMSVTDMFEGLGTDRLIIMPGGGSELGVTPVSSGLSASKLYEHDVDVIKDVRGIVHAYGLIVDTVKLEFKDQVKYGMVYGVPTDPESEKMSESMDLFKIETGKELKESDQYKVVIASGIAEGYFDEDIEIGDKILISDVEFRVIGIQEKSGSPMFDNILAIPKDTARELFDMPEEVTTIYAQVESGLVPREVAERVEEAMRKDRGVKEGEEDFNIQTSEQLVSSVTMILGAVEGVLIGIAAISLLVGGIGIMNTMYTSVMEQTRNIGLMKAVGARGRDVMLLFLIESGLVGLLGGVIGILIGSGLGIGVEIAAASMGIDIFKAAVTPSLVIGVLLFSFFIGTISGLMPARRASRMDPIESLRYR